MREKQSVTGRKGAKRPSADVTYTPMWIGFREVSDERRGKKFPGVNPIWRDKMEGCLLPLMSAHPATPCMRAQSSWLMAKSATAEAPSQQQ